MTSKATNIGELVEALERLGWSERIVRTSGIFPTFHELVIPKHAYSGVVELIEPAALRRSGGEVKFDGIRLYYSEHREAIEAREGILLQAAWHWEET